MLNSMGQTPHPPVTHGGTLLETSPHAQAGTCVAEETSTEIAHRANYTLILKHCRNQILTLHSPLVLYRKSFVGFNQPSKLLNSAS